MPGSATAPPTPSPQCTNSYYPTQSHQDEEFDKFQVGTTYKEQEYFDDEYVAQGYTVQIRWTVTVRA